MRRNILIVIGIVAALLLTVYQFFSYIGASSYCTGTSSVQYYGTLACLDDDFLLFGLFIVLNIVLLVILISFLVSKRTYLGIKYGVSALCAAYVLAALLFSFQFWMVEPERGCYWQLEHLDPPLIPLPVETC